MAFYLVEDPTRVNRRFAAAVFKMKADCKITDKRVSEVLGFSTMSLSNWTKNRAAMSVKNFEHIVDVLPLPESYFLMEDDDEARRILEACHFQLVEEDVPVPETVSETDPETTPETTEEPAQPVWIAEFPSTEALIRFLVSRVDETMYRLETEEEMQDYIAYCLENRIPVVIKPGD